MIPKNSGGFSDSAGGGSTAIQQVPSAKLPQQRRVTAPSRLTGARRISAIMRLLYLAIQLSISINYLADSGLYLLPPLPAKIPFHNEYSTINLLYNSMRIPIPRSTDCLVPQASRSLESSVQSDLPQAKKTVSPSVCQVCVLLCKKSILRQ